jgi:hypothetical protein
MTHIQTSADFQKSKQLPVNNFNKQATTTIDQLYSCICQKDETQALLTLDLLSFPKNINKPFGPLKDTVLCLAAKEGYCRLVIALLD